MKKYLLNSFKEILKSYLYSSFTLNNWKVIQISPSWIMKVYNRGCFITLFSRKKMTKHWWTQIITELIFVSKERKMIKGKKVKSYTSAILQKIWKSVPNFLTTENWCFNWAYGVWNTEIFLDFACILMRYTLLKKHINIRT